MIEGKIVLFWLTVRCVVYAFSDHSVHFETTYEDVLSGERCLGACICYDGSKTVNCSGKDYDYVPYNIPENTLVLDLSHNIIRAISPDDLQNLHNISRLDLSYNEISLLGVRSFEMMAKLRVLRLTNNADVFLIRQGTLASLHNLEELYFGYTAAQGLFNGVFSSQNKLTVLNIDNSNIFPNSFSNVTFDGLVSLRELSMAASYLYEIPMDVMQPFRDTLKKLSMRFSSRFTEIGAVGNQKLDFPILEELDFAYSQISSIAPDALSSLPKLKLLDLTGNSLLAISPRAFVDLPSLQFLNISRNYLLSFPIAALQPLSESLLDLRMSGVYFSEIRNASTIFSDGYLARLESLRIEDGNLASIAEDSFFKSLRSLTYLSVANSKLGRLPTDVLVHLESLETADLSGNPITRISSNDIPELSTLRHLHLSSTNIEVIDDDAFSSVILETLKLDSNKLTNLSTSVFAQQTNLTYLDISFNLLQTADINWFVGKSLQKVSLSGNPWDCDCAMTDFYHWMSTTEYLQIDEFDSVICEQPRKVKGYPLSVVKESDLSCEVGECPSSCICAEIQAVKRSPLSSLNIIAASSHTPRRIKKSDKSKRAYVSPLDALTRVDTAESLAVVNSQADCTGSKLIEIPKVPNTTEYLNVAQNLITQLRRYDISYLHEITTFIASDNNIAAVDDGSFDGLDLLEIIYMNKNRISQAVELSWLSNLRLLKELRLDDNMIGEIGRFAFADLESLDFLDLSRNKIITLPADAFTGLQNLTFLNLAANEIASINETTFRGLQRLRYLYLNDNSLTAIPSVMIQMNFGMEYLDLSENFLGTISDNFLESESLALLKMEYGYNPTLKNGSFRGLPSLEVLRLEGGFISQIEEGAWNIVGESKLHTLDMAYNVIQEIPLVAFQSLVNLESLGLSGNQISTVPNWESDILLLPKLKTLFLAKNPSITNIPAGSAISNFSNLTALVMNECSLTKVPVKTLLTTQIQYLVLDGNPITELGDDISLLTQLRELQLGSASSLGTLSEGAFLNLSNLQRIILSDGQLSEIPAHTFAKLKNLEVIDISNNKLTQPRADWFADLDGNKVKSVVLYDNPWECDCNAIDYKMWLDALDGGLNEQFFSITCASPQMYKSWSMSEINYSEDVCSTDSTFITNSVAITTNSVAVTTNSVPMTTNSVAMTTNSVATTTNSATMTTNLVAMTTQGKDPNCARCIYNENTKIGNCSGANLKSVPRGCFPTEIEKLHLSQNTIREIQSDDFANLYALNELDLKGNSIQQIADEAFKDLQQLSNLDLSSNLLSEIPSSALSWIDASLLILNLDYQRINRLATESLPLTNLIELSIKAIHDSAILQRLTIDDFAFAKLPSLTKLDMSHNKVSALGKDTLTGLHELQYLNMAATKLSNFPYQSLWRVPKITDLILDDNSIEILGHSTVPLLKSLQIFSLRNNNLRIITDDSFLNSCEEIQELDFGVNLFTKIPTYLSTTCKPKLEMLRFDHSLITAIHEGDFPQTTKGTVDLSNSLIHTIADRAFLGMDRLSQLFLNNNSIAWIADDSFTNAGLQYLDLSFNELQYISCAWIEGLQNPKPATVDVSGNRFNCSCGMIGYRHYIGLVSTRQSNVTVTGDTCSSPEEFADAEVESVNLEDMQSNCGSDSITPPCCGTKITEPQTTASTIIMETTSGSSRLHSLLLILIAAIFLTHIIHYR